LVSTIQILFLPSRSKFYDKVIKLSSEFDQFKQADVNNLIISQKELFEKWETFNLIFWKIVDWKGSILEYEGIKYQSHIDKTRIFYALQHAHAIHICEVVSKIKDIKSHYPARITSKDYLTIFN